MNIIIIKFTTNNYRLMQTQYVPTAYEYINQHWNELKELNLRYVKVELKGKCQPYVENKLGLWFN